MGRFRRKGSADDAAVLQGHGGRQQRGQRQQAQPLAARRDPARGGYGGGCDGHQFVLQIPA